MKNGLSRPEGAAELKEIRRRLTEAETGSGAIRDGGEDAAVLSGGRSEQINTGSESDFAYRRLFESAKDGFMILDAETGTVVDVNPFLVEMLGSLRQEFCGKKVWDLGFFKDIIANHASVAELRQQEYIRCEDKALRTSDGREIDVEFVGNVYQVNHRSLIQCSFRDITERKHAEEKLRASQQLFEEILNAIPVRVFWKDKNLVYLGCNSIFARDAGFADPKDIVGKNDYQMVWRDQADLYRADDRRVIDNVCAKVLIEEPQTTPDGNNITLLTSKIPLVNSAGEVRGVLGTYVDITGRKQAEDAIAESQGQLKAIFEAAADGILLADTETMKFRSANSSICRMLGYSQEQMLSLSVTDIHPKEDLSHVLHEFERQAKGDIVIAADVPMRRKDGSVFFADINSTRVSLGDKNYLLGFIRDITERKHSEEAMLRAISALKALSHCNTALIHASDEGRLLNEICRIIVVIAGYRFAWVGFAEHDTEKTVRAVAHAGYLEEVIERAAITWGNIDSAQGLIDTAIRTLDPQLVQDAFTDSRYESHCDDAIMFGYRSVLCLPLAYAGTVLGALSIYASDQNAFGEEEIHLLSGLANELAFGIVTLRARAEHQQSAERLRRGMESTVEALAGTLELRDAYTAGHQRRVAELAAEIARDLGCSEDEIHGIHLAGTVHDLGKIQVPAEILTKPTQLSKLEFELVKTHAQAGYELLKDIDFPWPIAQIVYQHHERLDGSGYPRGLRGNESLIGAKIIAVADTIEAMSSHRPYRAGLGIDAALVEITKNRAPLYDAAVVDACVKLFREGHFAFST